MGRMHLLFAQSILVEVYEGVKHCGGHFFMAGIVNKGYGGFL